MQRGRGGGSAAGCGGITIVVRFGGGTATVTLADAFRRGDSSKSVDLDHGRRLAQGRFESWWVAQTGRRPCSSIRRGGAGAVGVGGVRDGGDRGTRFFRGDDT